MIKTARGNWQKTQTLELVRSVLCADALRVYVVLESISRASMVLES